MKPQLWTSVAGQFVRPVESEFGFSETKPLVKGILAAWFVLLIPWLPFVPLCGMAYDAGNTWEANVLVWSTWLYPVMLYMAFVFRRRIPLLVLLPLLNAAGFCVSAFRVPGK
jgi:hypothetical protein